MGTAPHLWAHGLVQGNDLHLSEAHPALQRSDTWQEEAVYQRSICSNTIKMQAQEKAANIKQPWHRRADVNPKHCFCICWGCCRATAPSMHTPTPLPAKSDGEGWRNLSGEKCRRWLLQPFSFASRPAGNPRKAVAALISPKDACATASAPSTSREAQDFKSTQGLCPPPQLVPTICAARPGSRKWIWAQVRRWKRFTESCNAQLLRYTFPKIILFILQELPLSRNCGQVLEQTQSPLPAFAATTIPFLSSRAGQIILIQNTFERFSFFKGSHLWGGSYQGY